MGVFNTEIKAIQRLSDGAIIEADKGQMFAQTKKSYELWQLIPLTRLARFNNRHIGFVWTKETR